MITIEDDRQLYSSQKDEETPDIVQRSIPEPDDIGISIKCPEIKSDVKEIDPALIDLDNTAQPEPKTEVVASLSKTNPPAGESIIDRIVLTIYQLLY